MIVLTIYLHALGVPLPWVLLSCVLAVLVTFIMTLSQKNVYIDGHERENVVDC